MKLAAGNGFKKIYVGKDAIMATPAMSAFIRRRKAYGAQQQRPQELQQLQQRHWQQEVVKEAVKQLGAVTAGGRLAAATSGSTC